MFIILQIVFATRAVFKIREYPRIFRSFSWGIFAHVTRLDQSRTSENISWIISSDIFPQTLCVLRSEQFSESVETDHVQEQICEKILIPNGDSGVYFTLLFATRVVLKTEEYPVKSRV